MWDMLGPAQEATVGRTWRHPAGLGAEERVRNPHEWTRCLRSRDLAAGEPQVWGVS